MTIRPMSFWTRFADGDASRDSGTASTTSLVLSWLVIAGGIAVLAGWHFDVVPLKSLLPYYITMKVNTALSFVSLGLALLLLRRDPTTTRRKLAASALLLLIATIALLTLGEYAFHVNLGVDELLYPDPGGRGGRFPPGRLAPITAVNFLLASGGLALSHLKLRPSFRTAHVLVLLSFVLAFQGFVGYFLGTTYTFGVAFYSQMAVHTTVLFILGTSAIFLSRPRSGLMEVVTSSTAGGALARNLVGSAIVVPPLVLQLALLGEKSGLYDANFTTLLRVVGNSVFFGGLVWRNATTLHRMDLKRRRTEEESEARIVERTVELTLANAELKAQKEELAAQQRELERKNVEVERANQLKSMFLANMSHELRTPLNSIIGFSDLLLAEAQDALPPHHVEYVTNVLASGKHLLDLINDILDLSKIEAGEIRLEVGTVDSAEAVAEAVALIGPTARAKQIEVRKQVWATRSAWADRGKLRQILLNLLSNAVKFSPEGADVEVRTEDEGPFVRFRVRDEGPGIDPALRPHLFEPFIQGESPLVKKHQGTGLGLAISKRLVELHGGTLQLVSETRRGSEFTFTLPAAPGERLAVLPRASAPADGRDPAILVVETEGSA